MFIKCRKTADSKCTVNDHNRSGKRSYNELNNKTQNAIT